VLPTGEVVRQLAYRLEAEPRAVYGDVVVAANLLDVDRVGLNARLTGKVEYPARYFYFGGAHPETSL